jgi:hypothetical protein
MYQQIATIRICIFQWTIPWQTPKPSNGCIIMVFLYKFAGLSDHKCVETFIDELKMNNPE